jgi:glycosyltransferase involved in cell wall biosynthesis
MASLLFVTGTPASVEGGSGTYVGISVLRDALTRAGHRVDLLSAGRRSAGTLSRVLFNLGPARAAVGGPWDAVVGFDLDGLFVSAPGARRVASIKGVIADEMRFERGGTRLGMFLASRFEKRHVRRADVVVTTSDYAARRIAEEYGVARESIRVVPEPIALPRWETALAAAPAAGRGEPAVLCVAHLYPRKNIAGLLRALLRMREKPRLFVIGTGPDLPALRRLAGELGLSGRVELCGHVPFERLAAAYRNSDVFCLPSLQEGFGIVFLEAMAAGLPVVACRAAAVPEVVPDGQCGLLVPPGDEPALAAALDRLIGNPDERRRMGAAGRRRAASYDAPIVAGAFLRAIGL